MIDIKVVYAFDEGYVAPFVASVRSLYENKDALDEIQVAVLACSISSDTQKQILKTASRLGWSLIWVDVDNSLLDDLPTRTSANAWIDSLATYARLLLGELLPKAWDRVISLDPDTVITGSLRGLWATPLNQNTLAAAVEYYWPVVSSRYGVPDWRELGLRCDAAYFNVGVMLLDLREWRERQVGEQAMAYVRTRADTIFMMDQEALNAIVGGDFIQLDPAWNANSYWRRPERCIGVHADLLQRAHIRHFSGQFKPWRPEGRNVQGSEEFFLLLNGTDWASWGRQES